MPQVSGDIQYSALSPFLRPHAFPASALTGQDRSTSTNSLAFSLTGLQMRQFAAENNPYLLGQLLEFSRVRFRLGFLAQISPIPHDVYLHSAIVRFN